MGLFNQHQDTPRIDYQGHQYTLAAFIDKFNAVAAQLAQAAGSSLLCESRSGTRHAPCRMRIAS